jgi:hypothetical protein
MVAACTGRIEGQQAVLASQAVFSEGTTVGVSALRSARRPASVIFRRATSIGVLRSRRLIISALAGADQVDRHLDRNPVPDHEP